ncbi:MAG: hypothetical protein J6W04_00940 [Bacteroidales bacterium]|nr:hypothetical protein [Bacteroidales bacterium]
MLEFLKAHLSSEFWFVLGIIALGIILWMLKNAVSTIVFQFRQALKDQQEQIRIENLEGRNEREYDYYLLLRGMQVMTDLDHELVHCVMTGTHNGGLEKANAELNKFKQLSNENLVKKAAKWNIKIDS